MLSSAKPVMIAAPWVKPPKYPTNKPATNGPVLVTMRPVPLQNDTAGCADLGSVLGRSLSFGRRWLGRDFAQSPTDVPNRLMIVESLPPRIDTQTLQFVQLLL